MLMDKVRMVILALIALAAVGSAGVLAYRGLAGEPRRSSEGPTPYPAPPAVVDGLPPAPPAPPGPPPAADPVPVPNRVTAPEPIPPAPPGLAPAAERLRYTYRTANFVATSHLQRYARIVAEAAEHQRRVQARLWLGKELPDWPEPCRIIHDIDVKTDSYSCFHFDKGRLVSQEIHVGCNYGFEVTLARQIPHEVAHTIFASHFRGPIPRWADEGAAMLAEDEDEQQVQEQRIGSACKDPAQTIPLARLFPMQEYPRRNILDFYAQTYSVVRFLVGRKDRPTFLAFVRQGMRDGWDTAAEVQYGFASVEELEKAWRASLPGAVAPLDVRDVEQAAGGKPARLSAGPPPTMALARITPRKWLRVRVPVTVAIPVTTYPSDQSEPRTSYQINTTERVEVHPAGRVKAFDTDGRRIPPNELARLLQEDRPVLLSADSQKIDPFYLRFMKEGTVVLVVQPEPSAPPAQAAPPPPTAPTGN